jgi:hypothetical protein
VKKSVGLVERGLFSIVRQILGSVESEATGTHEGARSTTRADDPQRFALGRAGEPLALSGRQRSFSERLTELDQGLGAMYLGALYASSNMANPDSLAQAAQSARELMEKLPRRLGAEQPSRGGGLTSQVRGLQTVWERYRRQARKPPTELLGEQIDQPLVNVLRQVEVVISWTERHAPGRRAEARTVIREIDISGVDLPDHLLEQNVREWIRLSNFFNDVAHHRGSTTPETVDQELRALERFLWDRLIPETTEDLQAIDEIIGEQGA